VLNDAGFIKELPNLRYSARSFRTVDGQSIEADTARVRQIVSTGRERYNSCTAPTPRPDKDGQLDIDLVLVPKNRPTVGSTVLGKQPVRTGYWFVNAAAAVDNGVGIARHLMHEWLHIAGFFHAGGNKARGDVPYAVGDLVSRILRRKSIRSDGVVTTFADSTLGAMVQRMTASDPRTLSPADQTFLTSTRRALVVGENELLATMFDEAFQDESDVGENHTKKEPGC